MFLGHKNDVGSGTYKELAQDRSRSVLINQSGSYLRQDNICPHQGSRIRTGHGRGLRAVCPYHGFSWREDGTPLSSGTVGHSSGSSSCENTQALWTNQVHDWSGFLFSDPLPLDIDISGDYELVEYRQDTISSSPVPVMDLFLDIDHIPVVHPGVYDKIDIPNVEDITWQTWAGGSAQLVAGTPSSYSSWSKHLDGRRLSHYAAWIAVYPYTMFEWQPGAVFVMVNEPRENNTLSHVFKYRDHSYSEKNWLINEEVWEEAWKQDRQQAELLEPGWRHIAEVNLDTEKQVYRQYLRQHGLL
jgi:nitrite reductase/ring-hydroxylating ferredoxin subunit